MTNQPNEQTDMIQAPSIHNLKCEHCGAGADQLQILGVSGSKGKELAIGLAFGAIGNLVANAMNKDDLSFQPIKYKCKACKKKMTTPPLLASEDEILAAPCTVRFKRLSSFVGMAVSQTVWINSVKVGAIGNGKVLEFQTMTKHNTLFVTDQYGMAFKGDYKFEAQPNTAVDVFFKRKFKQPK